MDMIYDYKYGIMIKLKIINIKIKYICILKFIIIGDSSIGKSNILLRFTDNRFQSSHDSTIGVEFATKIISRQNTVYKLQIWDTAGQETFRSITRSYYRGTIGCLMVYDITNRESFESLEYWMSDFRKYCDPNTVIVLIGNKADLIDKRQVSYDEGKEFAEKHGFSFFETSAKTGINIADCFNNVVDKINNKIKSKGMNIMLNKIPKPTSSICAC